MRLAKTVLRVQSGHQACKEQRATLVIPVSRVNEATEACRVRQDMLAYRVWTAFLE